MKVPTSLYRLQLNEDFTLKEAIKRLPVLKKMGFEGVYCSPYFEAHSAHGYDITNPNKLNTKVASPKDFETFCQTLKKLGLFHIADVVPNHMSVLGNNKWWLDVLEKGKKSQFASFFDIDLSQEKISVPILPTTFEEALKEGIVKKVKKGGKTYLHYAATFFPYPCRHYQLTHWLSGNDTISYRRFFNICELIGMRIEDPKVLQTHHKWLFQLLKEKKIDGLRIDHPDGLYDPKKYFAALREKHKGLIVVEKILGWEEELPAEWDVEGTVGYEYLNQLTGLFVQKGDELTKVYERFIGEKMDFDKILYEKKKFYIKTEMKADVEHLAQLGGVDPQALTELLAVFPIYRTYIRPKGPIPDRDIPYIKKALKLTKKKDKRLEEIFTLKEEARDFILKFQQLSAPIMAKGFEDITLYNYNRLLALNEVGSSPERGGVTVEEFHHFCQHKQKKWPYGFLTTTTHDTKRSHDARMQIAVLSERPKLWEKALRSFAKLNQKYTQGIDPNDEYFLYQILLGIWPENPSWERVWASFQKSIREARNYTSWRHPDLQYEKKCQTFVKALFNKKEPFYKAFTSFQKEIFEYGQWNSLSSTALHLASPGIVEVYQGCENWRYLLVDPDNRSPVDYTKPKSGKTHLHEVALAFRCKHKKLFLEGEYIPIYATGAQKDHIVAFIRKYKNQNCLVAALRHFVSLEDLSTTTIILPHKIKGKDLFSKWPFTGKEVIAKDLFAHAPYAWVFWMD